jgi:hypothetical protein
MANKFRHTTEDCPVCEDGELLQADYERFCDTCHAVMDQHTFGHTDVDSVWQTFWEKRRANSNGFHGDGRAEFVGSA